MTDSPKNFIEYCLVVAEKTGTPLSGVWEGSQIAACVTISGVFLWQVAGTWANPGLPRCQVFRRGASLLAMLQNFGYKSGEFNVRKLIVSTYVGQTGANHT